MMGRLLATAALAVFAFVAMANGLDRVSARAPSVERVVPWPFRAQADRSAASDLTLQRPAAAVAHAIAAVKHEPVDPDSTAVLGAAHLTAADEQAAADAFRVAARFGWRNAATQLYWYEAALQAGDFRVAADRADAILRAHPTFAQREALLQPLETSPAGRKFLMQHLAAKPRWLESYIRLLADDDEAAVDRRVSVLAGLGAAGIALGCDEVSQFTAGLMDRSRRIDAERVWNANCPAQPIRGLIADPGFRQVDAQPPFSFGWRPVRTGDVEVRNSRRGEGAGTLVVSNTAPSSRPVLYQPVSLPPGNYRLRLKAADAGKAATGRLSFSLGCELALPFPAAAAGDPSAGGQVIHAGECKRQRLGLWLTPGPTPVSLESVQIESVG
jgi:hypothetical protein